MHRDISDYSSIAITRAMREHRQRNAVHQHRRREAWGTEPITDIDPVHGPNRNAGQFARTNDSVPRR